MKIVSDVQGKVAEAMVRACADMLTFVGSPSIRLNAEYLFTVNVAKAIARLNSYHADPYKVFLEQSTKEFSRNCLRPIVFGHYLKPGSTVFRKGTPKINRNGRIDVAVYIDHPNNDYVGHQPLCAIEVKAFNPQRTLVLYDLKRNLEYFRLTGATGGSVVSFTLFAALYSFPKCDDESEARNNEECIKKKYGQWLSELGPLDDIDVAIESFTVSKELLGELVDEGDHIVLDTDARHHFVGAIVRFTKRPQVTIAIEHKN